MRTNNTKKAEIANEKATTSQLLLSEMKFLTLPLLARRIPNFPQNLQLDAPENTEMGNSELFQKLFFIDPKNLTQLIWKTQNIKGKIIQKEFTKLPQNILAQAQITLRRKLKSLNINESIQINWYSYLAQISQKLQTEYSEAIKEENRALNKVLEISDKAKQELDQILKLQNKTEDAVLEFFTNKVAPQLKLPTYLEELGSGYDQKPFDLAHSKSPEEFSAIVQGILKDLKEKVENSDFLENLPKARWLQDIQWLNTSFSQIFAKLKNESGSESQAEDLNTLKKILAQIQAEMKFVERAQTNFDYLFTMVPATKEIMDRLISKSFTQDEGAPHVDNSNLPEIEQISSLQYASRFLINKLKLTSDNLYVSLEREMYKILHGKEDKQAEKIQSLQEHAEKFFIFVQNLELTQENPEIFLLQLHIHNLLSFEKLDNDGKFALPHPLLCSISILILEELESNPNIGVKELFSKIAEKHAQLIFEIGKLKFQEDLDNSKKTFLEIILPILKAIPRTQKLIPQNKTEANLYPLIEAKIIAEKKKNPHLAKQFENLFDEANKEIFAENDPDKKQALEEKCTKIANMQLDMVKCLFNRTIPKETKSEIIEKTFTNCTTVLERLSHFFQSIRNAVIESLTQAIKSIPPIGGPTLLYYQGSKPKKANGEKSIKSPHLFKFEIQKSINEEARKMLKTAPRS